MDRNTRAVVSSLVGVGIWAVLGCRVVDFNQSTNECAEGIFMLYDYDHKLFGPPDFVNFFELFSIGAKRSGRHL